MLLQAGQNEVVQQAIPLLLVFLKSCEQYYHFMEVLLLQARCYWEAGDKQQAFSVARELIALSAPQMMFRLLLDEGDSVYQLLNHYLKNQQLRRML